MSKTRFLVMLTAPPPVLMAMPAPELAWILVRVRVRVRVHASCDSMPKAAATAFAQSSDPTV